MKEIAEGKRKSSCGCWACGCFVAFFLGIPVLSFLLVNGYALLSAQVFSNTPRSLNPEILSPALYEDLEQRFNVFLANSEAGLDAEIKLTEIEINSLLEKHFNHKDFSVEVKGRELTILTAVKPPKPLLQGLEEKFVNCNFDYTFKGERELSESGIKCFGEKDVSEYTSLLIVKIIHLAIEDAHKPSDLQVEMDDLLLVDHTKERMYEVGDVKDGVVTITVSKF